MNMGYISDTARNRTHDLFHLKREPIPLGHSDEHCPGKTLLSSPLLSSPPRPSLLSSSPCLSSRLVSSPLLSSPLLSSPLLSSPLLSSPLLSSPLLSSPLLSSLLLSLEWQHTCCLLDMTQTPRVTCFSNFQWSDEKIIIIIIIMNFYSPVSNTRCHSIGHKMRIAWIKIRVDSPGRWCWWWGRIVVNICCIISESRTRLFVAFLETFKRFGSAQIRNTSVSNAHNLYVCLMPFNHTCVQWFWIWLPRFESWVGANLYIKASITAQGLLEPLSFWGSTLGTRAAEHKGCNWGMQVDWWLEPFFKFGHSFSVIS